MPDKPMRLALTLTLFFALTLTACEGPTGPEGPEGPEGPPGLEGPQGPPGTTDVRTATFVVRASHFQDSGSIETARYLTDYITQTVVDMGAVLAYTNLFAGGEDWMALPFSIPLSSTVVTLSYSYGVGGVRYYVMRPEGSGTVASVFDDTRLKVVAIPSREGHSLEALQSMSYEEVAARFELE